MTSRRPSRPSDKAARAGPQGDWRSLAQLAVELFNRLGHVHALTKTARSLLPVLAQLYVGHEWEPTAAEAKKLTAYQLGVLRRCDALLHHPRAASSDGAKRHEINIPGQLLDLLNLANSLLRLSGGKVKLVPCEGPNALELFACFRGADASQLALPAWVDCLNLAPTLPKARVPSAQRWALLLCHRQEQRFVNRLGGLMSQDEEYVHELRVALRRLRSALRIFADVLPQGLLTMRDALREWGRMLSPVRDEDVFLAFLHRHIRRDPSSAPALGPLLACSLAQRDRKLRSARRFFASGAFRERQRQLETMLSQSASGSSGVRPVAKRQVNRRLANVLRFPADLHDRPEEELHRLRIACKRLRYCCEFFEPMKRKVLSELASTAQGMQDSIGEHRDAGLFLQEVQTAPASRSKARRQVIEGVIQALHDRQQRRLADAHRAWQAFGKTRLARKGRVQLGVAGTWDLRQTTLV